MSQSREGSFSIEKLYDPLITLEMQMGGGWQKAPGEDQGQDGNITQCRSKRWHLYSLKRN